MSSESSNSTPDGPENLSRRDLLAVAAVTGGALIGGQLMPGATPMGAAQEARGARASAIDVRLRVNGSEHQLSLDPRTTLLDALREHLKLTGSKKAAASASAEHARCCWTASA